MGTEAGIPASASTGPTDHLAVLRAQHRSHNTAGMSPKETMGILKQNKTIASLSLHGARNKFQRLDGIPFAAVYVLALAIAHSFACQQDPRCDPGAPWHGRTVPANAAARAPRGRFTLNLLAGCHACRPAESCGERHERLERLERHQRHQRLDGASARWRRHSSARPSRDNHRVYDLAHAFGWIQANVSVGIFADGLNCSAPVTPESCVINWCRPHLRI